MATDETTGQVTEVTTVTPTPGDLPPITSHEVAAWHELRRRRIAEVELGAVLVVLCFPSAYWTSSDGRISSAMGMAPTGVAWKLTGRDGDTYTVEREDGQVTQTFTATADFEVIAVVEAVNGS